MAEQPRTTERQRRIVEVYRRHAANGQPPPTHCELCKQFGWKSTGTARDHIRALVRKGILAPAQHRSRGTHLAADQPTGRLLPLVGRIVAGRPLGSEEHVEREVLVPTDFAPRGRGFALRVSGDSMEGVGIYDNDLVIVRRSKEADPGAIVAVTIEGESTLKVLTRRGGKWALIAANEKYPAIEIGAPADIHGVVVAVMREIKAGNPQVLSWTKFSEGRR